MSTNDPNEPNGARPRILFVDDEESVLSGLRVQMRRQRGVWAAAFACGGHDALRELDREPVDVIVSDMRMPRMDGAELLARVRDRWPETVRIVLTGEADRDLTLRAIPVAQQWLGKPCPREALVAGIERGLAARALVGAPALQAMIGQSRSLPVAPKSYERLMARMQDPSCSLGDIAAVVEGNTAMAARTLQMANSALFCRSAEVSSVRDAIALLGMKSLSHLVLGVGLFDAARSGLQGDPDRGERIDRLERDSVRLSRVAGRLLASNPELQLLAATAGILHGAGQLLLMSLDRARARQCEWFATERRIPTWDAERTVLGTTHGELGGALLSAWGLPSNLVLPIAHHHSPATWHAGFPEVAAALLAAEIALAGGEPAAIEPALRAGGFGDRTAALARLALAECEALP